MTTSGSQPAKKVDLKATEVKSGGLGELIHTVFLWVKVVVLVVMIVLFVIVVIQNMERTTKIWLVVEGWSPDETPVAFVVGASFLAGVVMTLIVMFLRRGSRKASK